MNKYTEAIQGDDVVILCDGIPMGVGEILAALNAATPPADAALADELDRMSAELKNTLTISDDIRVQLNAGAAKYLLATLSEAAARLRALSQPEVAQVPIEWRRTVRELMTLTNFRPLCQKNVMDGCRCYDCVMERAGAILDEQSPLSATPLPADAVLADAVALLRRTYQNHWPSTEIKAFLAKIDAMPDAAIRALSQPEVAQVPAVPMAAIETVLHFCSPHEDASKEDCSKCSAAYEEVSNWRDALLSAASVKCDGNHGGNHGGKPCADKECWAREDDRFCSTCCSEITMCVCAR